MNKTPRTVSVLLQLDNSTAVAYINNLGGTVSPTLTALAKSVWLWALERDIMDCGSTHSRCIQHDRGQRVQTGGGSIRLDATSQCLPEDQPSIGSTRSGPVCLQVNPSVTSQKEWFSYQQLWQSNPYRVGLLESSTSHPFHQIPIYIRWKSCGSMRQPPCEVTLANCL